MIDFGESNKMIEISGKGDKSVSYYGFKSNILFFKPVISVWFIQFSTFFYHL